MGPLDAAALPFGALRLVDGAPIIHVLEGHAKLAQRFQPIFDRHAKGEISFAVTTIALAAVLAGPLKPATKRSSNAIGRFWNPGRWLSCRRTSQKVSRGCVRA